MRVFTLNSEAKTYTFPEGPGFFICNTLFQLIHVKIDREWLGPQIMP